MKSETAVARNMCNIVDKMSQMWEFEEPKKMKFYVNRHHHLWCMHIMKVVTVLTAAAAVARRRSNIREKVSRNWEDLKTKEFASHVLQAL